MDWIKKNKTLVVSVVVALVALGGAGYYLMAQMGKNTTASAQLASAIQRRNGFIQKRSDHPGFEKVDNIKIAKDDVARLEAFKADLSKGFKSTTPVNPTERDFKQHLAQVIEMIEAEGERSGLMMPTNFNLSFTAQKVSYQFASNSLDQLTMQLADLTEVAKVLVDARVNSIEQFKRVAVSEDDSGNNAIVDEYLPNYAITTNEQTGAVVYPYEVSFRSFSEELGDVLERIAASEYSILVKTIAVEPANVRNIMRKKRPQKVDTEMNELQQLLAAERASRTGSTFGSDPSASRGGRDAGMQAVYGGGGNTRRRPSRPTAPPTGLPPSVMASMQPTGPEVLLQPEPLRVTLGLAVVRMPEPEVEETANN